jgi:hypothetical protein
MWINVGTHHLVRAPAPALIRPLTRTSPRAAAGGGLAEHAHEHGRLELLPHAAQLLRRGREPGEQECGAPHAPKGRRRPVRVRRVRRGPGASLLCLHGAPGGLSARRRTASRPRPRRSRTRDCRRSASMGSPCPRSRRSSCARRRSSSTASRLRRWSSRELQPPTCKYVGPGREHAGALFALLRMLCRLLDLIGR